MEPAHDSRPLFIYFFYLAANQLLSLSKNGLPLEQLAGVPNPALEEYVWEFCGLCWKVEFNEVALMDCFYSILDEPLYSLMPWNTGNCTLEQ